MDNNQQDMTPVQVAASDKVTPTNNVGPTNADGNTANVTNLGIHEPKTMAGSSVGNPLTGTNVSMTTAQPFGGPIVSTEAEPNVRREAGPY